MLKIWLKTRSEKQITETDAYSQILTQEDPYFQSFNLKPSEAERERQTDTEECPQPGSL